MTEINGFEVDKFNQYDLKVGATSSTCPLCSHDRKKHSEKCASLNWDRGLGNCHHCGETFQLHTFKRKTDKVYIKPVPNDNNLIDARVVDYFRSRGLAEITLKKAKITTRPGWIEFNYYANGELVNVKSRNAKKDFRLVKDAERILYNIDSTIGHDYIVIVEGEIDALSVMESGVPSVVSVPNGATVGNNNLDYLDNCIGYFEGKSKIVLATDQDEAGEALKNELIRRLGSEICYICDLGGFKDLNEVLVADGPDHVRRIIDGAVPLPIENVQTLNDIRDELNEFVVDGFKPGFTVGLDNFDSIFSTYTGQFITVTGIPSSGKSDFVDQMVVGYNQRYGWKTAYVSPENKPTFLHAHKLMRKIGDWMPEKQDIDGDKWNKITEHIDGNYYFVDMDTFTLEAVLKKGAELVKRKGIRCLVIDPFNKVKLRSGKDLSVTDYTMDYLTAVENFCRRYDVLVIVVAHPTKMYKNEQGKIDEPTMYNIKGGGEWYDASYHGLLVHRDYEAKTTKVKVLKCKFQHLGENNAECYFKWNHVSGRYEPIEQETTYPPGFKEDWGIR